MLYYSRLVKSWQTRVGHNTGQSRARHPPALSFASSQTPLGRDGTPVGGRSNPAKRPASRPSPDGCDPTGTQGAPPSALPAPSECRLVLSAFSCINNMLSN